jgi:hypothetical protein
MFTRNVSGLLPVYMMSYPRKLCFLFKLWGGALVGIAICYSLSAPPPPRGETLPALEIVGTDQWSATWCTRSHLTPIKTKHRNRLNLEPALILALTKIRPRIEVLACQKHAQSSH